MQCQGPNTLGVNTVNCGERDQVKEGVPVVAQQVMNLTSIHKDEGSIPGLAQSVKDPALP